MNLFQSSWAAAKQPVSQESSNRLELKSWNAFANLCYWSGFLPSAVIAWNLLQVWWLGSIWFSRKSWSSLYTCCIPIIEHHEPSLSNFSISTTKLQRNTVLLLLWWPKRAPINQWLSVVHQVIPNTHSCLVAVSEEQFHILTLCLVASGSQHWKGWLQGWS